VETGSISGTVARGGIYIIIRRVLANLIRMVAIGVLARNLTAAEFGVVVLAQVAVSMLTVFSGGGVGTYILCDRETDWESRIQPAFWLGVALTIASCAVVLAFLPLIKTVYDEALVTEVLLVVLADHFIRQLKLVPDALLQRTMRFRVLVMRDTARDFATAGVAVWMAVAGFGVWSLVLPSLMLAPFEVTFTAWVARFRPRKALGRAAWPRIFKFTRSVMGEQLLSLISNEADTAVVAKVLGSSSLGVYNLAYQLANLIGKNVSAVLSMVSMPALAAAYERKSPLGPPYRRMMRVLALTTTPLLLGMFVLADELVLIVYGHQWDAAVPLLRIFIVFTIVRSVTSPSGTIFSVVGRPELSLKIVFYFLVLYIPALLITSQFSVVHLAVCVAAARVIVGLVSLYMSLDVIDESKGKVTNELSRPLVAGIAMAVLTWFLNAGLVQLDWPILIRVAVVALVGAGVYLALIRVLARRALEESMALIKSAVMRRRPKPTPMSEA